MESWIHHETVMSGKDGGEIQAGIPLGKGLNLLKSS